MHVIVGFKFLLVFQAFILFVLSFYGVVSGMKFVSVYRSTIYLYYKSRSFRISMRAFARAIVHAYAHDSAHYTRFKVAISR